MGDVAKEEAVPLPRRERSPSVSLCMLAGGGVRRAGETVNDSAGVTLGWRWQRRWAPGARASKYVQLDTIPTRESWPGCGTRRALDAPSTTHSDRR